jgi:GMP synthase (glutamine-hydrolysing)
MTLPLAIVLCGRTEPSLRARFGDFDDWFARDLGGPTLVIDAERGAPLPEPAQFAGVVLTGSPAMVTDRLPWSVALEDWCRRADGRVPLLGVCFGHQLLGAAFGGVVADNPHGVEVGTVAVRALPAAASDPLFAGLPDPLLVQESHTQSVVQAPRAAIVLLANEHDPHQALRYSPTTWGVQFHPEFDERVQRAYLETRGERAGRSRAEHERLVGGLQPTPASRTLLGRFAGLCRSR